MFNKLMITLLLLTSVVHAQFSSFPVNATAKLLVALSQHFSCSSILLISEDFPQNDTWSLTHYLVTVRKRLSEESVPTSSARGGAQRGRPLAVIMKSLEKTRAYLAEVSSLNGLPDAVWVILLESTASPITTVFRDVYVPVNSQVLVVQVIDSLMYLTEVYQVSRDRPLKAQTFGTWEQNSGQRSWNMLGMHERRSNLEGLQFRVASHESLDLLERCEKNYNLPDCPLFTRTWSVLHSSMNCSPTLYMNAPDQEWGSETPNGSWTGQAGLVVSGKVDIAADWFTVTEQRMNAMDYTSVVISSKLYVYIGHNGLRDLEWGSFFKPLHRSVWCYVVFFTLTVPVCMTLVYHAGRKWAGAKPEPQCQTVGEALFCVFNALCQKGNDITPTGTPSRVVYLTWYIVTMILMASYSASLISILTNTRFSPPFISFQGMLDLRTYPLLLPRGSVYPDIFKTSKNDLLRGIYWALVSPYLDLSPVNSSERTHLLCTSRSTYLASGVLEYEMKEGAPCNIVPVKGASFSESLAMLLPKGSPYKGVINQRIQQMKEVGIVRQMVLSIYPKKESLEDNSFVVVEMIDVFPLFIVFLVGIFLSIVLLLLERVINKLPVPTWRKYVSAKISRPNSKQPANNHEVIYSNLSLD